MIKFLVSILIGALCGWIAGKIMKSEHGFLMNLILGIAGGFVGGLIARLLQLSINGIIGTILFSVIGSCLVIFVARKILK